MLPAARLVVVLVTSFFWFFMPGFSWAAPQRARQERSPPLGFPIAAALAGRRLAPPGSAAAIAGESAGSAGALLAALDGGGHTAVAIDAAAELDPRRAVIIDVAV